MNKPNYIIGIDLGKDDGGVVACNACGAHCDKKNELNRFLRRHPGKCQQRKAFTKQLAAGVRSVDADPIEGED
jgi:hypothetical protein